MRETTKREAFEVTHILVDRGACNGSLYSADCERANRDAYTVAAELRHVETGLVPADCARCLTAMWRDNAVRSEAR